MVATRSGGNYNGLAPRAPPRARRVQVAPALRLVRNGPPPTRGRRRKHGHVLKTAARRQTLGKRISKAWPTRRVWDVSHGMPNVHPSNQCYRRAILQALLHTPEFINFLNLGHPRCVNWQGCILCILMEMAHRYWADSTRSPARINQIVRIFDRAFNNYWTGVRGGRAPHYHDPELQHDSAELLENILWSDFHVPPSALLNIPTHQTSSVHKLVHRLFGVEMTRQVTSSCGHPQDIRVQGSFLMRVALNVAVRQGQKTGQVTLDHCLDCNFNNPRGDPECGRCASIGNHQQTAHLAFRITKAPLILPIVLDRTGVDEKGLPTKLFHRLTYPEILDLTRFTAPNTKTTLRYRLRAVAFHIGYTAEAGHWTAAVKEPNDEYSECNDERIRTQTGVTYASSHLAQLPEAEATLFIYTKCS